MSSSAAPREVSLLFDQYEVESTLGQGAMGVVYLARDLRIGRQVALKTLQGKFRNQGAHPNAGEYIERFRREAELCGSLVHPNIVMLYGVGWEGRIIRYLAMEYVQGESLQALVQRNGKLPLPTALKIIGDVLSGLAFAHGRGVIHRDIKPANILISSDGAAKITDFGIARSGSTTGDLTEQGQILGTPEYMSPEQVHGREIDGQSDLFSAGVVLFEMLTGAKAFAAGDIFEALYRVVNQPIPDVLETDPGLPRWIKRFLGRMTAKDPADRFLSAGAALRELRRLVGIEGRVLEDPIALEMTAGPHIVVRSADDTPTTPLMVADVERHNRFQVLHRVVPSSVAYSVLGGVLFLFAVAIFVINAATYERGADVLSSERLAEFREKRQILYEADLLASAGAIGESRVRPEKYLRRYPSSTAAAERLNGLERRGQGVMDQDPGAPR